MASVLCVDIDPQTMALLRRHRNPLAVQEAAGSDFVVAALKQDPTATEVLLLGTLMEDPLRLARHAGSLDQDLAVVIMAKPSVRESFGEAIDFLPSLGGDVICTNADDAGDLVKVLHDAARRTQGRRITRAQFRAAMSRSAKDHSHSPLYAEFLVRLLDQVPVAVMVLNSNGLIQSCNPLAMDLLGRSEQDMISRSLVLLFPEDQWESLSRHLAHSSATERRLPSEEFSFLPPNSERKTISISATPFMGRGGDHGTLVFLQDCNALRFARRTHRSTGMRIDDLEQLESMAAFAGEVARELNNELVPVVGNTDLLLQEHDLDPERREILERILRGGSRAALIAGQLHSFAGTAPLELERIELHELLSAELPGLRQELGSAITWSIDLGPEHLPAVLGDAQQLAQALRNLVTISARAIGDQGGEISLRLGQARPRPMHALRASGQGVQADCAMPYIELADDGCNEDSASRLGSFDRRALTRSTHVNWRLAAVVGVVRAHGGVLEIDFPPESGMIYRMLLPAAPEVSCQGSGEAAEMEPLGALLIVDDEEEVLRLTCRVLELNGLATIKVRTADEALELVKQPSAQISAMVADASLFRGYESTASFRDYRPNLPIILCSGYDRKRVEQEYVALAATTFLQKPFTIEELMDKVGLVLDVQRD